jgi:glycoside/pentoside/hexuronide:cation symporter, GPH family
MSSSPSDPVAATPVRDRVPGGLKAAYGFGNIAEGVLGATLSTFAFFYFTAVLGLSGTLAGAAMAISLVIDAFLDPLIGSASDNTRTRFGRRHPMMAASLIPLFFTLGLLFTIPQGLDEPVLFALVTALAIVHRIALSALAIPYSALGAELSNDYRERTSIVVVARLFGVVGTIIAVVLGYGVFLRPEGAPLQASAYAPLGWTCALVALVAGVVFLAATVRAGAQVMPAAPPEGGAALRRLPGEVREVLSNRSFRVLFAGLILFFAAIGSHLALSLHANVFFWKLAGDQLLVPSLGYLVGITLGVPATAVAARFLEKRGQVFLGLGILCASWTVLPVLQITGVAGLTQEQLVGLLTLNWMAAGIGSTITTIAYGSMMGDAADEHEHLFGVRREGLYFAGLAFAGKTATGLGTLVAGVGLDLVGFPRGMDGQALAQVAVPEPTVALLGWIYGPGTAALTVASMAVLLAYGITARRHGEIVAALGSRRAG